MPVDAAAEEQFGPYVVYERLGVGGMATVHRAIEHGPDGFERTIALKRLLPHLAEDASFIKSFIREAKLASILNHINIVQIHELGRVGTEYFISMEYIDGRDVRRLLRHARKVTGPPPLYVTVGLMIQLCDALDYAHSKVDEEGHPMGLVHRDISPSNLLVTSQGHLKVIDFGIAKAQSSQLRTQTGRIKGKLAYMAPEAISGSRELDSRSDIWACGVILHELCTARPLFASKNEYQTLLKVQKGDILPPSTFNQAVPPELDAIVFKALARSPDDRFSNAGEMREELLALKRRYALQTGYRDVASWIDWAFGLEAPPGFSADGDTSGVMNTSPSFVHSKTPRPPRNEDEEEAAEVVWGGGEVESEDGPVVLEEVPDVSAKHTRAKRDTEDNSLADDIPTPLPSHGTLPSIYGEPEVVVVPQPGAARKATPTGMQPIQRPVTAAQPVARPVTGAQPVARPVTGAQPVARPVTGAQPVARPVTGAMPVAVPRPVRPTQSQPVAHTSDRMPATEAPARTSDRMPATGPVRMDAPMFENRMAAQRARDSEAPPIANPQLARGFTRADTQAATSEGAAYRELLEDRIEIEAPDEDARFDDDAGATIAGAFTPGVAPEIGTQTEEDLDAETPPPAPRPSLTEEELFGNDAADVLAGISSQISNTPPRHALTPASQMRPSLADPNFIPDVRPGATTPSAAPSVPVVRFSKSQSIPPQNVGQRSGNTYLPPMGVPSTRPGVEPANAMLRPPSPSVARTPSQLAGPSAVGVSRSNAVDIVSLPRVSDVIVVPPQQQARSKKTLILILAGVLIAAGTAAVVVVATGKSGGKETPPAPPTSGPTPGAVVVPAKTTGTVKFVLEPADAEIVIEGKSVHQGSPWSGELAAGIHQIEIHKAGYKAWMTTLELSPGETNTMRVVLEQLTATPPEDATLTISSTPDGLDVYIDGQLMPQKTPIKTTLKVGQHTIALRQNGTDVWTQNVNAEAASDYEFNPSFTDAKKQERAQRTKAPARPAAPKAETPPPAAAGSAAAPATDTSEPAELGDPKPPAGSGGAAPVTKPL